MLDCLLLLLSACGTSNSPKLVEITKIGFSSDYTPPQSNFESPSATDSNFKVLEPALSDPYWTNSLKMDGGDSVITQILFEYDRSINFVFPEKSTKLSTCHHNGLVQSWLMIWCLPVEKFSKILSRF